MWHPDMPESYKDSILTGNAREFAKAIPDESIDLIFCDPVYDRIDDYRWLAETACRVLKPQGVLLAFCGVSNLAEVIPSLGRLTWRGLLCWNLKGPNNKRYGRAIDNGAWLAWVGGWPRNYTPLVWDSLPGGYDNHLMFHWQKNPSLVGRHLSDFCSEDGVVFDPFTGGGTVPVACKMLGRHYTAFEIDPDTAERARQRVAATMEPLPGIDEPEQTELALDTDTALA